MRKFNALLIRIIFTISILTLISTNVNARELGVGPSFIIEPNMLKGTEYTYTVFIYNTGNDYDNLVKLTSQGDTKNWTTYYEYGNTTDPINLTYIEYKVNYIFLLKNDFKKLEIILIFLIFTFTTFLSLNTPY